MKKILIILLAITLYCNIGWMMGSYYYKNVLTTPHANLTTLAKVAAGGWSFLAQFLAQPERTNTGTNTEGSAITIGIFWPLIMIIIAGSWIAYFGYYACWFIFAGGAAKLLGLV